MIAITISIKWGSFLMGRASGNAASASGKSAVLMLTDVELGESLRRSAIPGCYS
jgi:hypothetical protein